MLCEHYSFPFFKKRAASGDEYQYYICNPRRPKIRLNIQGNPPLLTEFLKLIPMEGNSININGININLSLSLMKLVTVLANCYISYGFRCSRVDITKSDGWVS